MSTYAFRDRGAGQPQKFANQCPFSKKIDIPDIIANGGLEDSNGNPTTITAFGAADVLQVFDVPKGFWLSSIGVVVHTAEGAACTADIGNASATQTHLLAADADGYMGTIDLNSAVAQVCLVGDAQLGCDNNMGVLFVTDGTIDITFGSANTDAAIFTVFARGSFDCFF